MGLLVKSWSSVHKYVGSALATLLVIFGELFLVYHEELRAKLSLVDVALTAMLVLSASFGFVLVRAEGVLMRRIDAGLNNALTSAAVSKTRIHSVGVGVVARRVALLVRDVGSRDL